MTGKSTKTIKSTTTIKTTILALATAATLGTGFGAFEARAQYDDGDDDRPRRFERRYDADRYEHRRYDEDRYDRRPRGYGGGFGRLCLTQRGNCITRPQPYGSRCGCDIPGFGRKHGEIGG